MKFGVLTFGYGASPSQAEKFARNGVISINLGDYMQTLAVRAAFRALGIADSDVVEVDRDALPAYAGEPVALVMNGCFYDWCFPLPPQIRPVFVGFQAGAEVLARQVEALRPHQPIGCRDAATAAALKRLGVQAEVTGCLTLTLPRREAPPGAERTFVVHGDGAGALPNEILRHLPAERLAVAEFVHQRKIMHEFPLSAAGRRQAEAHAGMLLEDYRTRAGLVVTPLHHAATPCAAMGIPVVVARRAANTRFSHIRHLLPYHLPATFADIDWNRAAPDFSEHRSRTLAHLARALAPRTPA